MRWISEENSAPTDSPRWMRVMASPMSGATERTLILGSWCDGGSGMVSVMTTSAQAGVADAVDGRIGEHAVRGAGVHLQGALALERLGRLDERAPGVDLVVDDDGALAAHVADDVGDLGAVVVGLAPLLDDGQRRAEQLGERPRPLGEAEVGDHDEVLELLAGASSSRAGGRP